MELKSIKEEIEQKITEKKEKIEINVSIPEHISIVRGYNDILLIDRQSGERARIRSRDYFIASLERNKRDTKILFLEKKREVYRPPYIYKEIRYPKYKRAYWLSLMAIAVIIMIVLFYLYHFFKRGIFSLSF
ncbi:MAG: hypothetical protein ACE5K4_03525 [Candidatus Hydrothermarchaeota archaeon]